MRAKTGRFPIGLTVFVCLFALLLTVNAGASVQAATSRYTGSSQFEKNSSHGTASSATAGRSHIINGRGKGTAHPLPLSPQERTRQEKLLQKMHPALPPIPVETTRISHRASVAPTQLLTPKAQGVPKAAVSVGVHDLGFHNSESQVDEPGVASDGTNVLQTWNWQSAISTNGEATWTYYNPATLFPTAYAGWCCDSVTIYVPSQNIFVWNLQYSQDATGNTYRLAVANGASDLSTAHFHYWDLTPQQTNGVAGDWYDFPNLAISSNYAYLQANVFHAGANSAYETVVMRFALSDLAMTSGMLNYRYLIANGVFTVAFANGATSTMYFASHLSTSTLRVFSWDENSTSYSWNDVNHVSYPSGGRGSFDCTRTGGSNWCARADARVLSGWVSNGVIGFSWNAPQGKWGFNGSAPYPYTHIVRINEITKTDIDDPIVWNANFAFMYMSHYPNGNGDLGGTFMYGGGSLYEDGGAYVWDGQGRDFVGVVGSNQDATKAGDFLETRPLGLNWVGTMYALLNDGPHPYNVVFGR